ncbi:hypothetical protein AVEN_130377-1 [Araneus ventricosus]|uniref:Uncharacterized protein n=1 Tax=Araneus ventricosus TaxID=182803 RepID=A0A4Y2BG53_ARAVE|nr:hypothetical protein AVEN_130377-1 [Araneus ventricosus]
MVFRAPHRKKSWLENSCYQSNYSAAEQHPLGHPVGVSDHPLLYYYLNHPVFFLRNVSTNTFRVQIPSFNPRECQERVLDIDIKDIDSVVCCIISLKKWLLHT